MLTDKELIAQRKAEAAQLLRIARRIVAKRCSAEDKRACLAGDWDDGMGVRRELQRLREGDFSNA